MHEVHVRRDSWSKCLHSCTFPYWAIIMGPWLNFSSGVICLRNMESGIERDLLVTSVCTSFTWEVFIPTNYFGSLCTPWCIKSCHPQTTRAVNVMHEVHIMRDSCSNCLHSCTFPFCIRVMGPRLNFPSEVLIRGGSKVEVDLLMTSIHQYPHHSLERFLSRITTLGPYVHLNI